MSLQDGVYLPESEQMFLRQETSLAPSSIEDGAGMTLEERERDLRETLAQVYKS